MVMNGWWPWGLVGGLLVGAVLVGMARPSWIVRWILAPLAPRVLFCGRGPWRRLAITIDDGPSGQGSEALLALLEELQVPATLFLISGHLDQANPNFVAWALAAGHQIGHHMPEDQVSARLPRQAFQQQFAEAKAALEEAAQPHPLTVRWFRPGGGWFHRRMLDEVEGAGCRVALGSIFPWDTFRPPLTFLRWFVLHNAHPGGILILHDRPDTCAATLATLRAVIPRLKARNYHFVTLDALEADCQGDACAERFAPAGIDDGGPAAQQPAPR
jgi:peptidoglycan/xylan/chitin deacetylase (PgdA/CDA1 family)